MTHKNHRRKEKKKNLVAKELFTPKYRQRVSKSLKEVKEKVEDKEFIKLIKEIDD